MIEKQIITTHLETFFQDYSDCDSGIPSHWAVKYTIQQRKYPDYRYFDTYEEAKEFEDSIK